MRPAFCKETQSIPAVRLPLPCGSANSVSAGREPTQNGWYVLAAQICREMQLRTVLDVGAGMGVGLDILSGAVSNVEGVECDERLLPYHPNLKLKPLSEYGNDSFDAVTCIDTIEHVLDDLSLLHDLRRIASKLVVVSTPNWTRSEARNRHHCRELTIGEFMVHYRPDQVFVGSPDGRIRRVIARQRHEGMYTLYDGRMIPCLQCESLRFDNTTVDGHEWPHVCGVWRTP